MKKQKRITQYLLDVKQILHLLLWYFCVVALGSFDISFEVFCSSHWEWMREKSILMNSQILAKWENVIIV